MTDRELMQMALDALEAEHSAIYGTSQTARAIETLRARLAQPEPELVATLFGSLPVYDVPPAKPVAWVENLENARPHCVTDLKYCSVAQHERGEHLKYIPLYTVPPQREWQTLTENEIKHLWYEACQTNLELTSQLIVHLARNIEAKLKEKNT